MPSHHAKSNYTKSNSSEQLVVCVECGNPVEYLYKEFNEQRGNIRLTRCRKCRAVADKYIEFEGILLMIDMVLHSVPVYRHLLINRPKHAAYRRGRGLPALWKMLLAFIFIGIYARLYKCAIDANAVQVALEREGQQQAFIDGTYMQQSPGPFFPLPSHSYHQQSMSTSASAAAASASSAASLQSASSEAAKSTAGSSATSFEKLFVGGEEGGLGSRFGVSIDEDDGVWGDAIPPSPSFQLQDTGKIDAPSCFCNDETGSAATPASSQSSTSESGTLSLPPLNLSSMRPPFLPTAYTMRFTSTAPIDPLEQHASFERMRALTKASCLMVARGYRQHRIWTAACRSALFESELEEGGGSSAAANETSGGSGSGGGGRGGGQEQTCIALLGPRPLFQSTPTITSLEELPQIYRRFSAARVEAQMAMLALSPSTAVSVDLRTDGFRCSGSTCTYVMLETVRVAPCACHGPTPAVVGGDAASAAAGAAAAAAIFLNRQISTAQELQADVMARYAENDGEVVRPNTLRRNSSESSSGVGSDAVSPHLAANASSASAAVPSSIFNLVFPSVQVSLVSRASLGGKAGGFFDAFSADQLAGGQNSSSVSAAASEARDDGVSSCDPSVSKTTVNAQGETVALDSNSLPLLDSSLSPQNSSSCDNSSSSSSSGGNASLMDDAMPFLSFINDTLGRGLTAIKVWASARGIDLTSLIPSGLDETRSPPPKPEWPPLVKEGISPSMGDLFPVWYYEACLLQDLKWRMGLGGLGSLSTPWPPSSAASTASVAATSKRAVTQNITISAATAACRPLLYYAISTAASIGLFASEGGGGGGEEPSYLDFDASSTILRLPNLDRLVAYSATATIAEALAYVLCIILTISALGSMASSRLRLHAVTGLAVVPAPSSSSSSASSSSPTSSSSSSVVARVIANANASSAAAAAAAAAAAVEGGFNLVRFFKNPLACLRPGNQRLTFLPSPFLRELVPSFVELIKHLSNPASIARFYGPMRDAIDPSPLSLAEVFQIMHALLLGSAPLVFVLLSFIWESSTPFFVIHVCFCLSSHAVALQAILDCSVAESIVMITGGYAGLLLMRCILFLVGICGEFYLIY